LAWIFVANNHFTLFPIFFFSFNQDLSGATAVTPTTPTTPTTSPLNPELHKRLQEKAFQGMMLISMLKTMNRQVYHHERSLRNDLTDQKLKVGKVDLGYQNIKYQRKYLLNEIARCRDME
jgi:hypothetical protein